MDHQRCDNCVFWMPDGFGMGDCRRYPPTVYAIAAGNANQQSTGHANPVTSEHHWCGEHRQETP